MAKKSFEIKYDAPNPKTEKKGSGETEEKVKKETTGTEFAQSSAELEETSSDDFSSKNQRQNAEPLFRQNYNQSNKRQLGFRTREEFLEALKLEGKGSSTSGEAVLDKILVEYYSNNPDKAEFLLTARQMIKLSQKVT